MRHSVSSRAAAGPAEEFLTCRTFGRADSGFGTAEAEPRADSTTFSALFSDGVSENAVATRR